MKKNYHKPAIDFSEFLCDDVMFTSPVDDEPIWSKDY